MSYQTGTEEILASIGSAGPASQIEAALNDDLEGAGITGEDQPPMLIGSTLFNVSTAAADLLRSNPDQPVIERPIAVPNTAGQLASLTLRMINSSLTPRSISAIPNFTSGAVDRVNADAGAEQSVIDAVKALGEEDSEDDSDFNEGIFDSILFVTKEGKPAILKIYDEEPIGITFMPIIINGVIYPSQQFVVVEESEDLSPTTVGDFNVARMDRYAIDTIGPLRLAVTALAKENRRQAIRSTQDRSIPKELVRVIDRVNPQNLVAYLPDQQKLAQAYSELGEETTYESTM